MFSKETGCFEIGRTDFMYNSKNVVKISRISNSGEQLERKLNSTKIRFPLENNDQIIINGKICLLFQLTD